MSAAFTADKAQHTGTVLIVSRTFDMRPLLAALDLDGYEILLVRTPVRGAAMLKAHRPEVVLIEGAFWDELASTAADNGAAMVLLAGERPPPVAIH